MGRDKVIAQIERYSFLLVLLLAASMSLGLFIWELNRPGLNDDVMNNALTYYNQVQILKTMAGSFLITAPVFLAVSIKFNNTFADRFINAFLKSVSFLFLIPPLLNKTLWGSSPFMMVLLTFILSVYIFHIVQEIRSAGPFSSAGASGRVKFVIFTILAFLILGYTGYFSYYTIINHDHFATQAYDLGTFQNALVNTLQGHFMRVSFWGDQIFFQDHCDFVALVYLPFFYFFPRSETLLIVQSGSIALAALPLFLLCNKVLRSTVVSLLVVFVFLLQPANHCANFYDIHQLSFLPLSVFLIFYFMESRNTFAFIASLLLMLSLKADMCLVLFFVSLFIYFNNKKDLKFSLYGLAASLLYAFILFLVTIKWPLKSFAFYYEGIMVDKSGGLGEVFKAIATNPLYILSNILISDKILYFCQLFGPLVFIPLLRKQNILLYIYGLSIPFLATQAGLYEIHFQYVWYIVPFLFIGLVYVLKDIQQKDSHGLVLLKNLQGSIYPPLIAVLCASLIYSWQYGAILKRAHFKGGFNEINFYFSSHDKKRLEALDDMLSRIPSNASVGASTWIAPHILKQRRVDIYRGETDTRFDYILVFDNDIPQLNYFLNRSGYKVIAQAQGFLLLRRP